MRLLFSFIILLTLLFIQGQAKATQNEVKQYPVTKILSLEIHSSINPATLNYIKSGISEAESTKADLVLISLNTPGGLVTTTKEILTLFGNSPRPIVIWIHPEGASATSAGAIIASGAHLLYMSEGTNIGAATPIQMGSDLKKESDMRNKAINDLVALVQSLSEARGRNAKLFGEMISKASSFKSREAKEKNLINELINSNQDLLKALDGQRFTLKGEEVQLRLQTPQWVEFPMDLGQRLLNIFSNPSTAYILFLIGAALIYLELQAPGGLIAGGLGAISLVLAAIGFQVLPLNMGAMALIILSFILFIMEIYITSYGILSLGGLGSLIAGSLFLFRTDNSYMSISRELIFSSSGAIGCFILFIAYFWVRDNKNVGKEKFNSVADEEGHIIKINRKTNDETICQVKVASEIWSAEGPANLELGDEVVVSGHKENSIILYVNKLKEES
jgi:membrane-bound serine protease (ClpP class)